MGRCANTCWEEVLGQVNTSGEEVLAQVGEQCVNVNPTTLALTERARAWRAYMVMGYWRCIGASFWRQQCGP